MAVLSDFTNGFVDALEQLKYNYKRSSNEGELSGTVDNQFTISVGSIRGKEASARSPHLMVDAEMTVTFLFKRKAKDEKANTALTLGHSEAIIKAMTKIPAAASRKYDVVFLDADAPQDVDELIKLTLRFSMSCIIGNSQ
jgi:hypothetical protein